MSRILNSVIASFFFASAFSQALLTNNGTTIKVNSGTILFVDGDIDNKSGSTLSTSGELRLTGDIINNGTMSGSGTLYLWGSSQQDVDLNSASVDSLQVNKSGAFVLLQSPLTVNTDIDFSLGSSSFLTLGNNSLTLSSSASITGSSVTGFVVTNGTGKLIRNVGSSTVLFPIGSANGNYTPASLTNSGTADNIGLRVIDSVYNAYNGNGAPSGNALNPNHEVHKTWIINEAVAGGSNLNLALTWNTGDEGNSFDRNNSAITFFMGGAWQTNTNGIAASGSNPFTISRSGLTNNLSNTPFGVGGSPLSPLPITWLSFDVTKKDNDATLAWITGSETNSSHFDLQRSHDGINFENIGSVKAAGNSHAAIKYNYIDFGIETLASSSAHKVYYRIQQMDIYGNSSLSTIKGLAIGNASNANPVASLFPNPSNGNSFLLLSNPGQQTIPVRVCDATGRVIDIHTIYMAGSPSKILELDGKGLTKGIYFVIVDNAGQQEVLRWVRD